MARTTGIPPVSFVAASAKAISFATLAGAALVASCREGHDHAPDDLSALSFHVPSSSSASSTSSILSAPAAPLAAESSSSSPRGLLATVALSGHIALDSEVTKNDSKSDNRKNNERAEPAPRAEQESFIGPAANRFNSPDLPFAVAPYPRIPEETSVVMVGGGIIPDAVLSMFALHCAASSALQGGGDGTLLVCSYATEEPEEGFRRALSNFERVGGQNITFMPLTDSPDFSIDEWRELVDRASGIFFTGGDQKRLYSRLQRCNLLPDLHARVERGPIVLGGTSAGTAIMSSAMIAGGSDLHPELWPELQLVKYGPVTLSPGFSIVPFVMDQHFSQRNRLPRLSTVVKFLGQEGIGIDEQTAVVFSGGRYLEVFGNGQATVVSPSDSDELSLATLRHGNKFDLLTRTLLHD